jgi:general secretion pathway protein H
MSAASRGFTLLEMLLVLVLAAALVTLVVPNFGPLLARAQLYTAARDVASALRYARGQALVRGRGALFELAVDEHWYRISGRNKTYPLPASIGLGLYTADTETVAEGIGRIRFFPDGSSSGGRVSLSGSGARREVTVNWLTGEVLLRED